MLESMFEWLLQPARSERVELPVSATSNAADGQPLPAAEVSTLLKGLDRDGQPHGTLQMVLRNPQCLRLSAAGRVMGQSVICQCWCMR